MGLIEKFVKLICFLILMNGCTYEDPMDLSLNSIEIITKEKMQEFLDTISVSKEYNDIRSFVESPKNIHDSSYILAKFTTLTNMESLGIPRGNAYFCDKPNQLVRIEGNDLYFDGVNTKYRDIKTIKTGENSYLMKSPAEEQLRRIKPNYGKLYRYDVFFRGSFSATRLIPEGLGKDSNQKYYLQYDLEKKPEDICYYMNSNPKLFTYTISNEVRISKEQLGVVYTN